METRSRQNKFEAGKTIVGYAAVFNSPTVIKDRSGKSFKEVIRPGAFSTALGMNDIRALYDHDSANLLGRTKSGTLTLSEDNHGLRFELQPPDTELGRQVMESIRRGDLDGASFGWDTDTDNWRSEMGMPIRELLTINLMEVSLVAFPAYQRTSLDLRSVKRTSNEVLRLRLTLQEKY